MRQIYTMFGIYIWSINFFVFIYWIIILCKTRKKDYPSWILTKISVKPDEWAKRRNNIKIIACIIAPIISLGHLKIVIIQFFTNKADFYEIFLPFLSISLPGAILFFLSFLIVNTFYKYSKKHHKRSINK